MTFELLEDDLALAEHEEHEEHEEAAQPAEIFVGKQRPSFQYYPDKARCDEALVLCSVHARLCWRELVDYMHLCWPYGHLAVQGRAMTEDEIRRAVGHGFTRGRIRKVLVELETAGVFSRTADGVIYCRRMVRDELARNARARGGRAGAEHGPKGAEHGEKGGRPPKVKTAPAATGRGGLLKPPPVSVSPSVASSSNTKARAHSGEENSQTDLQNATPIDVGAVAEQCAAAMVEAGNTHADAHDPALRHAIERGLTLADLRKTTKLKRCLGKTAGYVVATALGRLDDAVAAAAAPAPQEQAQSPTVPSSETWATPTSTWAPTPGGPPCKAIRDQLGKLKNEAAPQREPRVRGKAVDAAAAEQDALEKQQLIEQAAERNRKRRVDAVEESAAQ